MWWVDQSRCTKRRRAVGSKCRLGERLRLQMDFEEKTRWREERGRRGTGKLRLAPILEWEMRHAGR